ncbi:MULTISPECIES: phage tail protein [unclassified Pseudomonas]|jgi:phage-related tail fiber protein|uniref:phage tail protein n=1 Tax=unclassified Pseudomonas TaxID=196821 RepID=UPI0002890BAA|nr:MULTISPECIES: phage tail protein [unclassified Pseudomonas]
MADYYTLLTNAGIAYETACKAAGVPIKLAQISIGDGNGAAYNPAATATALKREVWRGPLNALFQDDKNPSWLLAEVTIPPEVGGWYVREAGIWTDTGILYAIVKYPESFKPVLATSGSGKEFYIRSIFETSNASEVTLLIDDNIVKATRAWVASYVADELAKLDSKRSVRVVTTANIVLSGPQQVDGVAVVVGDRVLVAKQTAGKDNGLYVVAVGAWVRATDADNSLEVTPGMFVSVEEGKAYGDSAWQLVTDAPIVLGTTALAFEVVAGRTGVVAGTYRSLTVDKLGRVIAGTNPTTLEGNGITDGATKTELAEAISGVVAKAGSTMSGQLIFQSGTEDTPELGFKTPTSEAYFDLYDKNMRIEAVSDGVFSTPLRLNLPTKSAYVFGSLVWNSANFDPAGKLSVGAGGWLAGAPAIMGSIGGLPASQLFSGASGHTTDGPTNYPNTVGLHMTFANPDFGADIAVSVNEAVGTLLFRNLGGTVPSGWKKVWHDGIFTPSSKISGNYCPAAGFSSGDKDVPYMSHSDGTVVRLQVSRPKSTALLAANGWSKNADTGEIIQWVEYAQGDMPNSQIINIAWPFQFPTQFLNAKINIKFPGSGTVSSVTHSYSGGTVTGCVVRLEEWAAVVQTGMVIVVEGRGF